MKNTTIYIGLCCLLLLQACKKDFLDQRPDKALLVPATPADMQALLDNNFIFNNTPGLPYIADGDFYTTAAGYNGYNLDMERNSYTWSKDIYGGIATPDWNLPYQQVFYTNVVLEGLAKLPGNSLQNNAIKGATLFYRAFAFYNLLQLFAAPYNTATAAADAGIPLRLQSDVTIKVQRGSVQQAYAQILSDLSVAREILPVTAAYKSRPTVAGLQALLARVYLSMGNYVMAGKYADSVLAVNAALIDYNTLNKTATKPFPRALPDGNNEVIFYSALSSYSFLTSAAPTYIDTGLYRSYAANDLRRVIFCRQLAPGDFKFKGNYAGTLLFFSGLATDELYLISAECRARAGDGEGAMRLLNSLLMKRWATGTFVPFVAADADNALLLVLTERRKELLGRGLRWADLRRLNTDPRFKVTLTRTIGGKSFSLEPGSKRYVYPIPDEEVKLGGLLQNER
jgi:hypothetical protein